MEKKQKKVTLAINWNLHKNKRILRFTSTTQKKIPKLLCNKKLLSMAISMFRYSFIINSHEINRLSSPEIFNSNITPTKRNYIIK